MITSDIAARRANNSHQQMNPHDLYALAFGSVAGGLIVMTGVGAGVIVVPVLITLFGLPPTVAVGTASAFSVLTRVMAVFEHLPLDRDARNLLFSFGRLAIPVTLVTALSITALLNALPLWRETIQASLKIAVILAAAVALAMLFLPALNQALRRKGRHLLPVATGVLIGATGIGGGVLVVPALLAVSNTSIKRVIGLSVIMGLILSMITGAIYGASGELNWRVALLMTAGSLVSMPLAGRLFKRANESQVRVLSGIVMALAIVGMVLDLAFRR